MLDSDNTLYSMVEKFLKKEASSHLSCYKATKSFPICSLKKENSSFPHFYI